MNNFIYENKTKVYFGKGGVREHLGSLLQHYGKTVLLAYGGGSIKKNGVYDEVVSILKQAGKQIVEFSGIMSNPTYAKVQEGARLTRAGVEALADFIREIGLPTTFAELGIPADTDLKAIADSTVLTAGCCKKLSREELLEILNECR